MAIKFKATVFRDRRRLLFVCAMAFLAGFLFYLRSNIYIGGIHISLITGAIYALVVGTVALLVCLFLPSARFMIEAIAISRLGLSLFVLAVPEIGYNVLANPTLTALVVVVGGMLVSRVLHGRILQERANGWRGRLLPRKALRSSPVRLNANDWQFRYVGWMDDMVPIPVHAD